ncbi:MAG: hypothetical protein L0Z50_35175 [Verrucomicrobiales bacterium]|nr:hypothetical protein [Verrucomicrobiales bacterium]
MRTKTGAVLAALAVAATFNTVSAQVAAPDDNIIQSRIRALEQELQDLKQTVNAQQTKTNENVKIEDLDQKIRVLERKQELANEEATAKAKTTPTVAVGASGLQVRSADSNFVFNLRGYVQADGRFGIGDSADPYSDTFLMRRVRPIFDGTLYKKIDYRVMLDFASGTTS